MAQAKSRSGSKKQTTSRSSNGPSTKNGGSSSGSSRGSSSSRQKSGSASSRRSPAASSRSRSSSSRSGASSSRSSAARNSGGNGGNGGARSANGDGSSSMVPVITGIATAAAGLVGGVVLGQRLGHKPKRVLGVKIPGTGNGLDGVAKQMKKGVKQLGRTSQQISELTEEVRAAKKKAEDVGKAIS
jgi:hypothetical protein